MNGPEHYEAAEACIKNARGHANADRIVEATLLMAESQVHATLALAAATALDRVTFEDGDGRQVTGTLEGDEGPWWQEVLRG